MDAGRLVIVIVGLLGYVLLGLLLRVTGVLKAEDAKPLNTLLIYVALPALIFTTVQRAELEWSLATLPALAWFIVFVGLAIAWGLTRALKLSGPQAGAFMLAAVFGNTAYMGYPVAVALLGDAGLVRAVFYDIFGNTAAVITVGTLIATRLGEHGAEVNPVREVVTFPPFIALAAALALHSVTVPIVVGDWLEALGTLVVPMIMVSVGLSLRPAALRDHLPKVAAISVVKLVVLPLVALTVGWFVLPDVESVRIAVLEAGVPTMMFTMLMGMRFRLDTDVIAAAILVTLVGSAVTIPLFQLLISWMRVA